MQVEFACTIFKNYEFYFLYDLNSMYGIDRSKFFHFVNPLIGKRIASEASL